MRGQLHVVMGGAGAIGRAVISALQERQLEAVAVERSKTIPDVTTLRADLLDAAQTLRATACATHVYLCVGIPYSTRAWRAEWPIVMRNTIAACNRAGARLIFVDNTYMYTAPLAAPFSESHAQNTQTRKGAVRKAVADTLFAAHRSGAVRAIIGRSADFYGPAAVNTNLYQMVLKRMLAGKAPKSICPANVGHTYSYTLDNGRALVNLALDESAYGQVWHLPVGEPVTLEEVTALVNAILLTNLKPIVLPRPIRLAVTRLVKPLREINEVLYQFDNPYIMSDLKFRERYPEFKLTPYDEGLRATVESFIPQRAHRSASAMAGNP
ncbi:MAG TPA: NAD-dependent epimerase/dehydratase family protein [Mycobacterium sp.]|nr:NAD-dependent epimerase/dehydratase family protein [Mycobacterium sp.]